MAAPTPFPDSICHGCRKHRLVETTRGTTFIRCTDPTLPKYQTQPIRTCPAFAAAPTGGE